jgi:hypothetical protein
MRKLLVLALGATGFVALVAAWMRYTRIGAGFANDVVNPYLVQRGISGAGASELGTLEHFGRRTGTRHLTPLHAIPAPEGFRFAVPLGDRSEWARNVLAAGHCRMQLHDIVYELDEPVLLAPTEVPDVAAPVAWIGERLGWKYLIVHRFGERPGALEPALDVETSAVTDALPTAEPIAGA